ncbi:hypothetical protein M0812_18545 [Anaeramoeba flamelloides]|uniref:Uncharacterized protein n=1 Tax=Anaeramoeba flamelloides TaxID=1746091 RepID=A0AAV7Z829_9EUKA|nr:hypothetical protein M0812_18545 [Anaeramoeba flamelloides]
MSTKEKLKAEIVFESDETQILRDKICQQEEQEELLQRFECEKEKERKRKKKIRNRKKSKKFNSNHPRISFETKTRDRFQTLRNKINQSNTQFLESLLDIYEQNLLKRKTKRKNTKKIKRKEIKIDENTKFVLFPLELIQIANNKKISTNNIDVNHSCQIEIINKEKNQKVVYNPTNTMFNNCVSKLNLKMVLLIFIAGFGFSDYLRIFSNLFESKSLMCTNTFYALQRSYIIPTIKKIWNEHQKRIQQRIEQPLQVYVDGRWSRPQRKKGTAEYLSEVLIDAKTQFVLAIDTLSKNDKKEGMGNEEAQCLIQILTTSPIKELEIDEIISDENKSLIKRIKETNLPVEISLCIGHKGNKIKSLWKKKCTTERILEPNQLTKKGETRKRPKYSYTYKHLVIFSTKVEAHFKVCCCLAKDADEFLKIWFNFADNHFGNHENCFDLCHSNCLEKIKKRKEERRERKKPLLKNHSDYTKCLNLLQNIYQQIIFQNLDHFLTTRQTSIVETFNSTLNLWCPKYKHFKKDVYEARTYMTALHWNYQLISCQNSKQFMINKQLSKQIQSQVLNSFEQYHPYFNKNKKRSFDDRQAGS